MPAPGVASCIIRFICAVPTGLSGFNSLVGYMGSKDLGDIFDVIPHGRDFLKGMRILGGAGIATFSWNFLQFGTSPFCRGYLLASIGVVDLALVIPLIIGIALASGFLPGDYGPCETASNWNNGTDGRNFFVVAKASGNFSEDDDANAICHKIVEGWIVSIVVVIIYIICGVLNVRSGCVGEKGTRVEFGSTSQYDLDGFPLLWAVLRLPFRLPFRFLCLVFRIFRGIYIFPSRYTMKYLGRQKRANRTVAHPKGHERQQDLDHKPARHFSRLRLPMELTILIVKDLHYTDLANLRHTSYHFRAVFFGDNDPIQTARDLQEFACADGGPSINCEICKIQTCQGCRHQALIPRSEAFQHLTGCQAACSKCFFIHNCVSRPQPARPGQSWNGGRRFRGASYGLSRAYSPTEPSNSYGSRLSQAEDMSREEICHACLNLPRQKQTEIRDATNLAEIQRQARLPMACFRCRKMLPATGVKWWVNSRTGEECKWFGHPGWTRKNERDCRPKVTHG
ncbi:uncharacterized protein C8A04DRAFT_12324 [Dichotomopilus funicola]|uniref:F-box domain-containing protein n=1 Tax=Dichotomopilus funicola TaxID=1934379 RepID=A0AAN6ZND9_9PEZI|nr:hypothetical protein C8A04DRAFT_12324 [Dichotomopilus funicola]